MKRLTTGLKGALAAVAVVVPLRHARPGGGGPLFTSHGTGTCQQKTIKSHEGWAQVRGQPSLDGAPLWELADGSAVSWRGRSSADRGGRSIRWDWVSFIPNSREPWLHEGWIASGLLTNSPPPAPVVVTPPPKEQEKARQESEKQSREEAEKEAEANKEWREKIDEAHTRG
jgi:hypothetical protein